MEMVFGRALSKGASSQLDFPAVLLLQQGVKRPAQHQWRLRTGGIFCTSTSVLSFYMLLPC